MQQPRSLTPAAWALAFAALVLGVSPSASAQPAFSEPGWTPTLSLPVIDAATPAFGPLPGELFHGRHAADGDVFRRHLDGRVDKVADTSRVTGLHVGEDGAVFYLEITAGRMWRVAPEGGPPTLWVGGFHGGDDAPVGVAAAPADFVGVLLAPGELVVTDAGVGGAAAREVYAVSPDAPDSLRVLHADDGTLLAPTAVAVTRDAVLVADKARLNLYRVDAGGGAVPQVIAPPLAAAPVGLVWDALTGTMLVATQADGRLLRLTPGAEAETWTATSIATGLDFSRGATYQALALSSDGAQLAVAESFAVRVFSRCDALALPALPDCDDNGVADICDVLLDSDGVDCDASGVPDACELASGVLTDCDADGVPDTCPSCGLVDLVFVMDTSPSMDDDAAVLCDRVDELIAAMAFRGLDVRATLLGIADAPGGAYACLSGTVLNVYGADVPGDPPAGLETLGDCAGGNALAVEDWGRATAIVAAHHPWLAGAARLIVPLTDEGPHCGDPIADPGLDRDAALHAARVARAHDVRVSPVFGLGTSSATLALGQLIAAESGGLAIDSQAASALIDELELVVRRACFAERDCNANDVPDVCDLAAGTSDDCDGNGVPDECDVRDGADCDANDVPDACDLAAGTRDDCDGDGRPDVCPACPAVDVLFLVDTSPSALATGDALCAGLGQIEAELTRRGVVHEARALGLTANPGGALACLTGSVSASFGVATPGEPPPGLETLGDCADAAAAAEDWGRAVAVAAAGHPWREGHARLVVPISDEAPHCGDPALDPGLDREVAVYAVGVARELGVVVSPILPATRGPDVVDLAGLVADATGGDLLDLAAPGADLAGALVASILSACAADYDCDGDGVPDSCQLASGAASDCDGDGVLDRCAIVRGADDCDGDGVPDACQIAAAPALDCDGDGVIDGCALSLGDAVDCDDDGVVDACQIALGAADADEDGVLDACQLLDCDGDGVDDDVAVGGGLVPDCDGGGRPDACDLAGPGERDRTWETSDFGTAASPGVVRDGDDNGVAGLRGYESRLPQGDPVAWPSTAGDLGSPLAGPYVVDWRRTGATLAITEFINDPVGADDATEWLELYNYGGRTVELAGWRVAAGEASVALPDVRVPPGRLVVLTRNAGLFFQRWGVDPALGGRQVLQVAFPALGDDGGELALVAPGGAVAWRVGWGPGHLIGVATHLTRDVAHLPQLGDCDGDGVPDVCQEDCNANGLRDACDVAAGTSEDCDGDGVPDECQVALPGGDCDASGVPDVCELALPGRDCDDDGVLDVCAVASGAVADCDGDGVPDGCQIAGGAADCDGDGALDACQIASGDAEDCDGDGIPDACGIAAGEVADCDESGIPDACEIASGAHEDCDGDGVPDSCQRAGGAPACDGLRLDVCVLAGGLDTDCDGNGVPDACDLADGGADCDGSGVLDACEVASGAATDCDGDGVLDACEIAAGAADCDGDGVPDACQLASGGADDCDGDGVLDACEIAAGAADCDDDGVPDACQLASGGADDCDGDGVLDACEIAAGAADCDDDGVPDACQVASGAASDCDDDGVLDACAIADGAADCDGDGVPDACQLIADGASDCDGNGVLDVCDLAAGGADCDGDGRLDGCAIAAGDALDCDGNGVPDACDLADGSLEDSDGDGIPDVCAGDCDGDGVADDEAIALGLVDDCDANGVPDACDPDCDGDGVPDACDDPTEVCDGLDNDCDGLTDAEDPGLAVFACPPGCEALTAAACEDGAWATCVCLDTDADGVPDAVDNCPGVANPGQEDADGDGIGDVCDPRRDFVLLEGGGGCAGGSGGPWPAVPGGVALALAWLLRRRRADRPQ